MHLYPLQFYPILKERIWGGNKLQTLLHKPYSNDAIGESWEISTVAENISIVSNGYFKDTNFIDEIGLKEHLSPTRANGLVSMIKQLKMYAVAYQTQLQ